MVPVIDAIAAERASRPRKSLAVREPWERYREKRVGFFGSGLKAAL
jgi:hypothetical protein